jgi:molybdopterin-binding protein
LNRIIAEVFEIHSLERLNLVKFKTDTQIINVLMLEMNMDLKTGKKAELLIKPTAISLCKERCNFENCLKGSVINKKKGKILSSISVRIEHFELECIMLNECAETDGDVFVLFKANDVAVGKVFK